MYSKLAFTNKTDRSVALQGLEYRLAQTMHTKVQFGIVESMLGRSLLWRAATPRSLERIAYSGERHVPSWSWMAYLGPITYEYVPFGDTEWCTEENIKNPFDSHRSVFAKDFKLDDGEAVWQIVFDETDAVHAGTQKCVLIGKVIDNSGGGNKMHYALIIQPSTVYEGCYERVGVGRLEQRQISTGNGSWVPMR